MDAAIALDHAPLPHALPLDDEDVSLDGANGAISLLAPRLHSLHRELRYRGLSMNLTTGAVRWHGESISLGASERALLKVLLAHAGRIISVKQLAALLDDMQATERTIEARIAALRSALERAGSRCLPHKAEG